MLSIQTNIAALSAQNALTTTNNNLQKSMERLSSGFRINHAADDAAGLAISEKMQAQIGGLNQAVRNANDGASMIQTAEGALDQVQNMMIRMRNLAVQAASDTQGPQERVDINIEIQQLKNEVDNISLRTTFNGLGLLDGSLVTRQNFTAIAAVAPSGTSAGNPAVAASTLLAGMTTLSGGEGVTSVDVSGAQAASEYDLTYDGTAGTLTLTDVSSPLAVQPSATIDVSSLTFLPANGTAKLDFGGLGVSVSLANGTNTAITGATVGGDLDGLKVTTGLGKGAATLQTGADASPGNTTTVSMLDTRLTNASASAMTALATAIRNFNTDAGTTTGPTDDDATGLITAVDTANAWISSQRAQLGAAQNRLGYAAASLTTTSQNVSAANSQIRDVDVATETSQMSKSQILMQAGVSVLAQANQVQQLALKLLG
jgi:flagellin